MLSHLLHFSSAVICSAGGRQENEDAVALREDGDAFCAALADGLGAYGAGDVAANLAVGLLVDQGMEVAGLNPEPLHKLFAAANEAILSGQKEDARQAGMRCTAVLLCGRGGQAIWAHIGDSRLYHFRAGRIHAQTLDHSLVQANVNAGNLEPEKIRFHEDRSRLLRSLGSVGELKPTILPQPIDLESGDAFLLASDGFWEFVLESEMASCLADSEDAASWLVAMESILHLRSANSDDTDNYSAIAVRLHTEQGSE